MYSLNNVDKQYTCAEKCKIIGSIILPENLLKTVNSVIMNTTGAALKKNVKEGKLDNYLLSWLCLPEQAYLSDKVVITLRTDLLKLLPSYALVSLPSTP